MVQESLNVIGRTPKTLDFFERASDHSGTIATTATIIIPPNINRAACWIINNSSVNMFVGLGYAAAVDTGILLNSGGGALEINKTCLFKGAIYLIAASGTGNKFTAVDLENRYHANL